jgi:hypothetical protein
MGNNTAWIKSHPEKWKEICKRSYLKHREERLAKNRLYYAENRKRIITQAKKRNKIWYKMVYWPLKMEIFKHYSDGDIKCNCCGCKDVWALCLDHVDNNGATHRRSLKMSAGSAFYKWIKQNNFPAGYQVLCRNCNWGKKLYGRCPHKD